MFIVCPKCSACYQLPTGVSLENGQKIKCSACEHIFLKGEEAPLPLTETLIQRKVSETMIKPVAEPVPESPAEQDNPPPEWVAPDIKNNEINSLPSAFQMPLYERIVTPIPQESDSLPAAFVPVDTSGIPQKAKRNGLWFVPIYVFVIFVFCWLAWRCRDVFMSSFTYMPAQVSAVSQQEKTGVPSVKPVEAESVAKVEIRQVVKKEAIPVVKKKKETAPVVKKEVAPVVNARPVVPEPVVSPALESVVSPNVPKPVVSEETMVKAVLTAVEVPSVTEAVDTLMIPDTLNKIEPDLKPEMGKTVESDEPLLDIISDPLPVAAGDELAIQNIHFQVVPDEQGQNQLLIDGILYNMANDVRSIPVLMATVWDRNSQILAQKKVHVTQDALYPQERVPFYTSLVPAPIDVERVDVRF